MKPSLDWNMEDAYQIYQSFDWDDETSTLYYHEDDNTILDCCGFIVWDIFELIDPNVLYLFKKGKESIIVHGKNGRLIHLVYPEPDGSNY